MNDVQPLKVRPKRPSLTVGVRKEPGCPPVLGRTLRRECGCAGGDDQGTGVRTLDVDSVPDIIGITHIVVVGNYAIEFSFPDGRDTDVSSWDRLYRIQRLQ